MFLLCLSWKCTVSSALEGFGCKSTEQEVRGTRGVWLRDATCVFFPRLFTLTQLNQTILLLLLLFFMLFKFIEFFNALFMFFSLFSVCVVADKNGLLQIFTKISFENTNIEMSKYNICVWLLFALDREREQIGVFPSSVQHVARISYVSSIGSYWSYYRLP